MGGAQKQLYAVATHLAGQGHQVTILCTQREPDATQPFRWHANAQVIPVFRFKQPYPEPYATPIYHIANAIQELGEYLAAADVYYAHDGGFIFPYVYQTVPTVFSLRSIIFAETLQSAFLFQGDELILISEYQRDVISNTVGRFFPALAGRTHVIYNGLDFDTFHPTPPNDLLAQIPGVDPAQHDIVLFPHRPEEAKGILQTIDVARRLVYKHGLSNLRVLVPRWIESALSPDDKAFYAEVQRQLQAYGLVDHFVFHPWISQTQIPQYYTLGDVTLAIGSYVETFGNVPYESLACGTPAIVARVGPARELLPEELIHKVDFGDTEKTAALAADIIQHKRRTSPQTMAYLKRHFDREDMVSAYADIILNARKRNPMPYVHTPLGRKTPFIPAPWVYASDDSRLYHDLNGAYQQEQSLLALYAHLSTAGEGLTANSYFGDNADEAQWKQWLEWYRDGWIVPVQGQDEETS